MDSPACAERGAVHGERAAKGLLYLKAEELMSKLQRTLRAHLYVSPGASVGGGGTPSRHAELLPAPARSGEELHLDVLTAHRPFPERRVSAGVHCSRRGGTADPGDMRPAHTDTGRPRRSLGTRL